MRGASSQNFPVLRALKAACEQKPNPGQLLRLNFELFPGNSSSVGTTSSARPTQTNSTSTPQAFTIPSTTPPPASTPSITPQSTSQPEATATTASSKRKGIATGVSIGVGVGVGIAGLGFLGYLIFWWRKRVRRNAMLQAEFRQQVIEASDDYLDHVLERRPYQGIDGGGVNSPTTQPPAIQKIGRVTHIVQLSTEYNANNARPPRRGWLI